LRFPVPETADGGPGGRNLEGNTAIVELLRDHFRGTPLGASIEHPAGQVRDARDICRLVQTSGKEGRENRDGRGGRCFLDDHHGAVVENGAFG
jgi:hypothetical protein